MKVLICILRICISCFFCAHPQAQQGAPETEQMVRLMLANQFAAGLKPAIKVKYVAGREMEALRSCYR